MHHKGLIHTCVWWRRWDPMSLTCRLWSQKHNRTPIINQFPLASIPNKRKQGVFNLVLLHNNLDTKNMSVPWGQHTSLRWMASNFPKHKSATFGGAFKLVGSQRPHPTIHKPRYGQNCLGGKKGAKSIKKWLIIKVCVSTSLLVFS